MHSLFKFRFIKKKMAQNLSDVNHLAKKRIMEIQEKIVQVYPNLEILQDENHPILSILLPHNFRFSLRIYVDNLESTYAMANVMSRFPHGNLPLTIRQVSNWDELNKEIDLFLDRTDLEDLVDAKMNEIFSDDSGYASSDASNDLFKD